MKPKILVGALLVAAALLVTRLVGLWGGSHAADAPPAPSANPAPAVTVAPPPGPASAAAAPAAMRLPEIERDDDPAGDLTIQGQVIDDHDQPVKDARVAIDTNPPTEVATDVGGSFSVAGLIARDYTVEATAPTGAAGPVAVRLTPKTEPITLRVRPAGSVEVVVTAAADGKPVADARVELRATLVYAARTDARGIARLANVGPGFVPLAVLAEGFAPAAMMVSTSGDPQAPARFAIALAKGAALRGRAIDAATKQPVAHARVVATDASQPFPVVDARRDGVVTAADGTFAFPALAAGTWRLTATAAGYGPATSAPIALDGEHAKQGVELALAAGATVKGKVVDKTGAPVAGADVRVVVRGGVEWRAQRQAYTAADGTFAIAGLPRRDVDVVAAHHSGASAIAPAELTRQAEVTLTLALDVVGTIAGTVVDQGGQGLGDAQVIAEPVFDGGVTDRAAWSVRGVQQAVTDQAGTFAFTGLPDGTYRVRAARPGAPASALDLAQPVEAKPNGGRLRIVVAADGKIAGKVVLKDGGAPASFTVAVGGTYPVPFAAADGTFVLAAPAGKQTIVVDGRKFLASKAIDVTVEPGKTADAGTITVEPGRSVSGRVLDETGAPVANAAVAAGALLTGGGKELYIPDESVGAKDTTTDADGRYRIEGFSPAPISLVAGKDGLGRSASVQLPRGDDSASVDLVLKKTSGLDGAIARDGKPLGDTVVIANPFGAVHASFFTLTGADGTFALDALSPGAYLVYPMIGGGGAKPKDMFVQKVEVAPGVRAHVAIDATPGPTTVTATVKTDKGDPLAMGMVLLVGAKVAIADSKELQDMDQLGVFGTEKPVMLNMRMVMGGAPVEIAGVGPGDHTLCVMPGRPDLAAAPIGVTCQQFAVAAGAAKQAVTVVVPSATLPK